MLDATMNQTASPSSEYTVREATLEDAHILAR